MTDTSTLDQALALVEALRLANDQAALDTLVSAATDALDSPTKRWVRLPRQMVILNDMADAKRRGDTATYRELLSQLQPPAWTLLGIKRAGHADYIRQARLDTSLADAEFGPGWLDRDLDHPRLSLRLIRGGRK